MFFQEAKTLVKGFRGQKIDVFVKIVGKVLWNSLTKRNVDKDYKEILTINVRL